MGIKRDRSATRSLEVGLGRYRSSPPVDRVVLIRPARGYADREVLDGRPLETRAYDAPAGPHRSPAGTGRPAGRRSGARSDHLDRVFLGRETTRPARHLAGEDLNLVLQ